MTRPADGAPRLRDDREVHLQAVVHPPRDLFERVVAAIYAEGSGIDLEDLRARLERFRASIDRERFPSESKRDR